MQSAIGLKLVAVLLVCCACVSICDAKLSGITFHNKYSEHLRAKLPKDFPVKNTPEYHQLVKQRDIARHGNARILKDSLTSLTFLDGNYTFNWFEGLYYTNVDIGTPPVPFLVALDTGSDIFWVPCECKACAPASSPAYGLQETLLAYNSSNSKTSTQVSCGDSGCPAPFSTCGLSTGQCTYTVNYGTPNTSSSGIVLEDVINLTNDEGPNTNYTSPIIFGCGQTQTGYFLSGQSSPDGLLGLGLESFSVPSMLAKSGLVGDSFSMCFDFDSSGRIVFGDYGSSTQATTPFQAVPASGYKTYYVGLETITVGTTKLAVQNSMLFDTGTVYTRLETKIYNSFLTAFSSQVTKLQTIVFDGAFDLCYAANANDAVSNVPSVDFNLAGGATFSVQTLLVPYIFQSNSSLAGFCVGLVDGKDVNIFGANIMVGYNFVFNRAQNVLGFEQANCSSLVSNSSEPVFSLPPSPAPTAKAPAPTAGAHAPTGSGTSTGSVTPTSETGAPTPGGAAGGAASTTSAPILTLVVMFGLVHFLLH